MNPILIALAVALGVSVLGNAFLGNAYLNQRDTATTVKTETVYVQAAAKECSKGTEAMATAAKKNASAAAPKRRAAASEAAKHDAQADQILAAPPAVPGDACKSAEAVVDTWWATRSKP
jgi:hypothetical protein